ASGEVLPKYDIEDFLGNLWPTNGEGKQSISRAALSRLSVRKRRRQQVMALVVVADTTKVADRVIREMKRGVTALHGRGMFLKQERDVLLIALTVTEIEQLKVIVRQEDPHAFITVIPANEVVGAGFIPLEEDAR
ncbi:MAG TPA: YitT family protein, partial [Promineifilum sp.]|nr:YitT family protein [Promineifilum sp.]